jgi:hypothetical protein
MNNLELAGHIGSGRQTRGGGLLNVDAKRRQHFTGGRAACQNGHKENANKEARTLSSVEERHSKRSLLVILGASKAR